jgi:hypothetical protein
MLRNRRLQQDYVNAVMDFLSQVLAWISCAASYEDSFGRRTTICLRGPVGKEVGLHSGTDGWLRSSYTLTREKITTRYVVAAIRTLVDVGMTEDIQGGQRAVQDAIKVS